LRSQGSEIAEMYNKAMQRNQKIENNEFWKHLLKNNSKKKSGNDEIIYNTEKLLI
jgi:hypothetical protein